MKDIILTEHAKDRGKERIGLSNDAMQRLSQKALEFGVKQSDVKGKIKRYMGRVWMNNKKADNLRLYSSYIFVFIKLTLITVILLPSEMRDYKKYIIKKSK